MSLRVGADGVRLTVPPRVGAGRIEAFLRAQEGWVAEQRARLPPAPAGLRHGDALALLDGALLLNAAEVRRASRRGDVLDAPACDLDRAVERWYREEALRLTARRADALAARLGVRAAGVSVRDPRARWGSCSSSGRLSFSWRLVLAPEAVLDYVVAHEVCHLLRRDHSPAFWALVAQALPGHGPARAWLRRHGDLLHRGPGWREGAPAAALSPA
jgi:predicted metal-dependent hydrolase